MTTVTDLGYKPRHLVLYRWLSVHYRIHAI